MIDANVFPKLIEILATGENSTRNEIAWAICNLTSCGTPDQIRCLVELNVIPPFCYLLTLADSEQAVEAALKTLENILKLSELNETSNPYAMKIRECDGLDKIERLNSHQNENISHKAAILIENFFSQ